MTSTGGNPPDKPANPPTAGPAGGSHAPADLLPLVYDQLRDLARHRMGQERAGHTLQATALVHEAYLRLAGGGRAKFAGRGHFFHAAAEAMRRILIEHARSKGRVERRRGGRPREAGQAGAAGSAGRAGSCDVPDAEEILAFDDAIRRLESETPDAAAVVRLRFYAGLSVDETAEALGVSTRTVNREWTYARAWLFRGLEGDARCEARPRRAVPSGSAGVGGEPPPRPVPRCSAGFPACTNDTAGQANGRSSIQTFLLCRLGKPALQLYRPRCPPPTHPASTTCSPRPSNSPPGTGRRSWTRLAPRTPPTCGPASTACSPPTTGPAVSARTPPSTPPKSSPVPPRGRYPHRSVPAAPADRRRRHGRRLHGRAGPSRSAGGSR